MKRALVSPNEKVTDYLGDVGERVAQVVAVGDDFPVAEPLFWVDCPDDCIADVWWYYENTCQIIPQPPEPV